jgi:SPP1 gp7 family putative phage head morphogenesis protein
MKSSASAILAPVYNSVAVPPSIAPGVNDPTKTLMLRRKFSAQMTVRFRELKGRVNRYIADGGISGSMVNVIPISNEYTYTGMAEIREEFMRWLRAQEDVTVLVTSPSGLLYLPSARTQAWTDPYVASAYDKGTQAAASGLRRAMVAAGLIIIPGSILDEILKQMSRGRFLRQETVTAPAPVPPPDVRDAAAAIPEQPALPLYMDSVFAELSGIVSAMNQQISAVLAEGMLARMTPTEIARLIMRRIDNIGITRARRLARTATSAVYNGAAINSYENLTSFVDGIILARYLTAGDSYVRPRHSARNGKLYRLDIIRSLFGEWNCRCTFSPEIFGPDTDIPKSEWGPVNTAGGVYGV